MGREQVIKQQKKKQTAEKTILSDI